MKMNALSLYVTTSRMIFQPGLDLDDSATWSDINRLIVYLRQALTCFVCGKLLQIPMSSTVSSCQHHVCKGCIGGKMRLKPSCSFCKDHSRFIENTQLRILLQSYKKLCAYISDTRIPEKWGNLSTASVSSTVTTSKNGPSTSNSTSGGSNSNSNHNNPSLLGPATFSQLIREGLEFSDKFNFSGPPPVPSVLAASRNSSNNSAANSSVSIPTAAAGTSGPAAAPFTQSKPRPTVLTPTIVKISKHEHKKTSGLSPHSLLSPKMKSTKITGAIKNSHVVSSTISKPDVNSNSISVPTPIAPTVSTTGVKKTTVVSNDSMVITSQSLPADDPHQMPIIPPEALDQQLLTITKLPSPTHSINSPYHVTSSSQSLSSTAPSSTPCTTGSILVQVTTSKPATHTFKTNTLHATHLTNSSTTVGIIPVTSPVFMNSSQPIPTTVIPSTLGVSKTSTDMKKSLMAKSISSSPSSTDQIPSSTITGYTQLQPPTGTTTTTYMLNVGTPLENRVVSQFASQAPLMTSNAASVTPTMVSTGVGTSSPQHPMVQSVPPVMGMRSQVVQHPVMPKPLGQPTPILIRQTVPQVTLISPAVTTLANQIGVQQKMIVNQVVQKTPTLAIAPKGSLAVISGKRRGCRCGLATPTPGKLTCCGQRCPCYVDGKGCYDCKCRGCRNPHKANTTPGFEYVKPAVKPGINSQNNIQTSHAIQNIPVQNSVKVIRNQTPVSPMSVDAVSTSPSDHASSSSTITDVNMSTQTVSESNMGTQTMNHWSVTFD